MGRVRMQEPEQQEDTKEVKTYSHSYWKGEVNRAENFLKKWNRKSADFYKRYTSEKSYTDGLKLGGDLLGKAQFPMFYSNVQTLLPAYYGNTPVPLADRLYNDKDPVAKDASELVERVLKYNSQPEYFDAQMEDAITNLLVYSRGVLFVSYSPTLEGGDESIKFEDVKLESIDREDFLYSPARKVSEVKWMARRWYKTRSGLDEWVGKEISAKIPLNLKPDTDKDKENNDEDASINQNQACGWEIWCKESQTRYYIAEGYNDILQSDKDPFGLGEKLPFATMWGTTPEGKLLPIPDFVYYKRQLDQLEQLCKKTDLLLEAVRVAGVYNASMDGIQRLLTKGSGNMLIPVKDWVGFNQSGGLSGGIQFIPLQEVVATLEVLNKQKEPLKQEIYEITGISDIIRGATKASETATAQQIKGQFASLRLSQRQRMVAETVKQVFVLMASIVFEKFQPQSIYTITSANEIFKKSIPAPPQPQVQGQPPQPPAPPQVVFDQERFAKALDLLKNNLQRQFRVDIETDSTLKFDEARERQDMNDLLQNFTGFMERAMPVINNVPEMSPVMSEMLKMVARRYRAGRNFETTIEDAIDKILKNQQAKLSQPSPQQQEAQARMENEKQVQQFEMQAKGKELQQKDKELQIKEQELKIKDRESATKDQKELLELKLKIKELESQGVNTGRLTKRIVFKTLEDGSETAEIETATDLGQGLDVERTALTLNGNEANIYPQ